MINIIVGQNASGKTLYLERLVDKFGLENVSTNLYDTKDTDNIKNLSYNKDKIDVLSDIMDSDIIETPLILNIIHSNIVASSKFIELATLMCRDKNILILDEPEFGLGGAEKCRLLDFINFVNPLYKEIYVSTHYESMIGLPNTRYYTVNMHENSSDLEITEISMESANEIMD